MNGKDERPDARSANPGAGAPLEGEVIPPGARGSAPDARNGGVFFDFRTEEGATFRMQPVSRWKLALILIVAAALGIAIVLAFASLFVIAAVLTACAAGAAVAAAWVKGIFARMR